MVSFRSCSWWLYKASPSSAAKNIMNLILYWPSGDVHVYSHFLGCWKRAFVWLACSFDKTLLAFALLHFVLQGQTYLLLWVSLDLLLLHSNPLWWKGYLFFFFFMLVLEGLVGLHRTSQLQLLGHQWLGHGLGLLWGWMVCLGNELRPFCRFWDCTQVVRYKLLLTMRATPFFSKGFFPTVVEIMVIWIKFSHSCPF